MGIDLVKNPRILYLPLYSLYRKFYHLSDEEFLEVYLIDSDFAFMEECMEDVLNSLTWPKETIISYDI